MHISTLLLPLLLIRLIHAAATNYEQCLLAMRLYPLHYIEKTSTMEFKIRFDSNCMPYFQMQYFVIPWNIAYDLTLDEHPSEVILILFERLYTLHFDTPIPEKDGDYTTLAYEEVMVSPSHYENISVNLMSSNYFSVTPATEKYFSKEKMNDFWKIANPAFCTVEEDYKKLICEIVVMESHH